MKLDYSHRDQVDPARPFAPLYYGASEEFVTVGGRVRRYLVYIPKDAMASTAGLMLLPEDGRTAVQVLEESVWKSIADGEPCQEKLILCILEPENGGAWQVDDARVYATGHSMGSLMTQLLAMALPETFAAVAPCSGVLFEELGDRLLTHPAIQPEPAAELPIWMFVGEQEPWLFPHLPMGDNKPAETIRLWWRRNHMPGAAPQDFTGGWTVYKDRWNDLIYRKGETPMIRYTWVDYLPHATMPEMSFRIWEAFFAHWSRGAHGESVWTD